MESETVTSKPIIWTRDTDAFRNYLFLVYQQICLKKVSGYNTVYQLMVQNFRCTLLVSSFPKNLLWEVHGSLFALYTYMFIYICGCIAPNSIININEHNSSKWSLYSWSVVTCLVLGSEWHLLNFKSFSMLVSRLLRSVSVKKNSIFIGANTSLSTNYSKNPVSLGKPPLRVLIAV